MTLKKLLLFTVVLVISMFTQVKAASVDSVKAAIVKHSVEMGVDPAITLSIAKVESGYRHEARSAHGAVGVFQLMPSTARRMGLNPYSLDDNIKGGVMYYKSMYKMFGSMQLAIAAYNAGPAIVKKYNAVPPFKETKNFVSKIMSGYYYLKAHTDPAVTAYYAQKSTTKKAAVSTTKTVNQQASATQNDNEKQVAIQKANNQQEQKKALTVLPALDQNHQIVAEVIEQKAPVPAKLNKNNDLLDKVNNTSIMTNSDINAMDI